MLKLFHNITFKKQKRLRDKNKKKLFPIVMYYTSVTIQKLNYCFR